MTKCLRKHVWSLGLVAGFCSAAPTPHEYPLNFPFTKKTTWSGPWCTGSQSYKGDIKLGLQNLKATILKDGSLNVTVWLRGLEADVTSRHSSEITLCKELENRTVARANGAIIKTHITFPKPELGPRGARFDVYESRIDHLEFDQMLSPESEAFITYLVNQGLDRLWSGSLGKRLNGFLTKTVNEKLVKKAKLN